MVAVGLFAVTIVVALAIIGTLHSSPRAAARTPPSTSSDPRPTPSMALYDRTVTYVNTTVQIPFGGMNRNYLLSRPVTHSTKTKLPVIVILHGRNVTAAYEQQRTNFSSVVRPSILVYPTGYQGSWNAGGCCGPAESANLDDVGFIKAVLTQVRSTESDASQGPAFLAGYSNGGKLALRIACDDPEDYAGIAVYGATDASTCPLRPAAPVLVMAGSADPELPPNGTLPPVELSGFIPPSFTAEVDSYRLADGCSATPVVTTVGDVTLSSWVDCLPGERAGMGVFSGQPHDWPGGSAISPSGEGVAWAWFTSLGA